MYALALHCLARIWVLLLHRAQLWPWGLGRQIIAHARQEHRMLCWWTWWRCVAAQTLVAAGLSQHVQETSHAILLDMNCLHKYPPRRASMAALFWVVDCTVQGAPEQALRACSWATSCCAGGGMAEPRLCVPVLHVTTPHMAMTTHAPTHACGHWANVLWQPKTTCQRASVCKPLAHPKAIT